MLTHAAELRTRLLTRVAFILTAVLVASIVYAGLHSEKVLIMKLDSTTESIRCSAAEELSEKGLQARIPLPKLQALLVSTSCVRFGEDQLPKYIESLGGIDPFINVMQSGQSADNITTAWWLRYYGHEYPQRGHDLVLVFIKGLHSQQEIVRKASAQGLGTLGSVASTAIPKLETALTDSDADVRTSAVLSLASLRSLEGLKTALAVSDPQVRRIAIQSLGGKSSGEVISANMYEDMVNDPELSELGRRDVRRRYPPLSVAAQRGYGAPAVPLLIGALDDADEGNRTAAAHALANLGRTALSGLNALEDSALHARSRDTRVEALHALQQIGPEALPSITRALDDADPEVRDYAVKLLASYGRAGVPALVAFLKRDWNVSSIVALQAMESLHRDALPGLQVLEHWALNAPNAEGRRAAINALALVGPEAFPAIEKAAHDNDPAVTAAAQYALKGMRIRYGARI